MLHAKNLMIAAATLAVLGLAPSAKADSVVTVTLPTTVNLSGQARWGNTGQEGILKTAPNPDINMNPVGAPIWQPGQWYSFQLSFNNLTGAVNWSIDFNQDTDFLDSQESVSSTTPFRNFKSVNIFAQGGAATSTLPATSASGRNIIVNNTNLTPAQTIFSGLGTAANLTFADSSGGFDDIVVTGELSFSGGTAQERPRLWVQLGDGTVETPEPASIALLGIGLAALGMARRRRRS